MNSSSESKSNYWIQAGNDSIKAEFVEAIMIVSRREEHLIISIVSFIFFMFMLFFVISARHLERFYLYLILVVFAVVSTLWTILKCKKRHYVQIAMTSGHKKNMGVFFNMSDAVALRDELKSACQLTPSDDGAIGE
jgi:Ca2+/Na+ antiporter